MDRDGYPTDKELKRIEKWDCIKGSVMDLLEYIESMWHWPEWGFVKRNGRTQCFRKKCIKLELHTGGWSGNESIIWALKANRMFWRLYWIRSDRGGHYYFEIREFKK
ncbi:MAG: hypothetical protein EHM49_03285 [Deltaproteobacteria bacterium]|nr:MAG: hypothetical protein EHM49_03285 [Deltaproteobacteria bacterium]